MGVRDSTCVCKLQIANADDDDDDVEFNIEKLQLVEDEKKKIRQEYERKSKQVEVRKKIEYSMQLNASRIKVLQAQDDVVNAMKDSASRELLRTCNRNSRSRRLEVDQHISVRVQTVKSPKRCLRAKELGVLIFLAVLSQANSYNPKHYPRGETEGSAPPSYCLSWRLAAEANNIGGWRTVPTHCLRHISSYMIGGQYDFDLHFIVDNIITYINDIVISQDGLDAFVLDVDDTCLSNLFFYQGKRFGCDPYDPQGFKEWAAKGESPAILPVLRMFNHLVFNGFKVFLVTGRDEETLLQATSNNLENQGFIGYERLILRSGAYRGKSAVTYKSEIRKQLAEEGYRIWGNVGDQWSDLHGDCSGNRTFKLPNPMYFVP